MHNVYEDLPVPVRGVYPALYILSDSTIISFSFNTLFVLFNSLEFYSTVWVLS